MEIRQLLYFTRVVELGGMGKAARDLGVVTSALSQQIARLESELSTRLLQRTAHGVQATDAGLAFFRQAQLALRHIHEATLAAQQARLSGQVSVGLAPTTASVLGLPLLQAMRERYPDIRLHLVEALSGHLATMLTMRQLDLTVLFHVDPGQRWSVQHLLDEHLFVIGARDAGHFVPDAPLTLNALRHVPLAMPTDRHGLRSLLTAATGERDLQLNVVLEIDSLAMLMDAVGAGLAATIQPGAAVARQQGDRLAMAQIADASILRRNALVSLSDDELSPAALATRVVMRDVIRSLVQQGLWLGASLHET